MWQRPSTRGHAENAFARSRMWANAGAKSILRGRCGQGQGVQRAAHAALQRLVHHLVLLHARLASKLARDDVSGVVVPVPGKVFDGDFSAGEAGLDKPLDLLGIHGHWAAFRIEIAPTHLRHHKLRRSPAATPHLSSQPAIPEPPARIVPLVGPSMSQLAIPAPDPSNPRGTPPGPRIWTPKSTPERS